MSERELIQDRETIERSGEGERKKGNETVSVQASVYIFKISSFYPLDKTNISE